jgi:hypothetical protein
LIAIKILDDKQYGDILARAHREVNLAKTQPRPTQPAKNFFESDGAAKYWVSRLRILWKKC